MYYCIIAMYTGDLFSIIGYTENHEFTQKMLHELTCADKALLEDSTGGLRKFDILQVEDRDIDHLHAALEDFCQKHKLEPMELDAMKVFDKPILEDAYLNKKGLFNYYVGNVDSAAYPHLTTNENFKYVLKAYKNFQSYGMKVNIPINAHSFEEAKKVASEIARS